MILINGYIVSRKMLSKRNKINLTKPLLGALVLVLFLAGIIEVVSAAVVNVKFEAETGVRAGQISVISDSRASGGQALRFGAATSGCGQVDTLLAPSCGAWLGTWANDHGTGGFRADIEEHETRIGRKSDVVHSYQSDVLTADDKYFINRADTILYKNWKPASPWSTAGGSNSSVNSKIDTMANSIKSVAPKKIFLTIYHEPENDVSAGAPCVGGYASGANSGSPAEYRAMWQNVRSRFDAAGVTNVVWVFNLMGFKKWDCMIKDMWPGNDLVDWVTWDPYPSGNETMATNNFTRFYNWLENNSDATHNFRSKHYGIGEWGSWYTEPADTYRLYDDVKASIEAGRLPKIKMYIIFDALGIDDSRVDYGSATKGSPRDATEMARYKSLVNIMQLKQPH